jgi:prepilin-type N-terminal cleavage/methylation domain-containing protein
MRVRPAEVSRSRRHQRPGFSLLELVINLVIIGMLAAIAVPRFSEAAQSAKANSLAMTLTLVRNAIEYYCAEHGRYPGYDPLDGSPDGRWFVDQMSRYSDAQGNVSDALVYPFIYGPYLRPPFPANPLNGLNTVRVTSTPQTTIPLGSTGWVAVLSTGHFAANSPEIDLTEIGVIDPGGGSNPGPLHGGLGG